MAILNLDYFLFLDYLSVYDFYYYLFFVCIKYFWGIICRVIPTCGAQSTKRNQQKRDFFLNRIFHELTELSIFWLHISGIVNILKQSYVCVCVFVCSASFEPAGYDNAYIEGTLMRPEQINSHEISSP